MKRYGQLIAVLLMASPSGGCALPLAGVIQRTAFCDWHEYKCAEAGITVELPGGKGVAKPRTSVYTGKVSTNGLQVCLAIRMHPFYTGIPANGYDYAAQVIVSRYNESAAEYLMRTDQLLLSPQLEIGMERASRLSSGTATNEFYITLRKSYALAEGGYIMCAGYLFAGVGEFRRPPETEIEGMERIMCSVKTIGNMPVGNEGRARRSP